MVLAGGDALRQERLTRSLHDALVKVDGVEVGFREASAPDGDGRKGGAAGDVALWAALGTAARPLSQVLITAIREWCEKERQRKVEVTYRDGSIVVPARPDEAQLRVIREFMDKVGRDEPGSDAASGGPENGAE
ncbi:hypothetical protein [Streptomyces abikoensis]|uniref:hypothetical protein n=1 Tax=Streptomyces abikoensis TaxID=97398 RepID=UPI0033FB4825